jgi:hypothetical protein
MHLYTPHRRERVWSRCGSISAKRTIRGVRYTRVSRNRQAQFSGIEAARIRLLQ